jgi:quinoprotein glucose dehydrogenase
MWIPASYDPETHIVYAYACNACLTPIGLARPPKTLSDMDFVAGTAGQEVVNRAGPGENAGADSPMPKRAVGAGRGGAGGGGGGLSVQGLPLIKPPYGTISAISLDKGEIVWQIAHGDTPDAIRNNAALKGINLPRTGQSGYNVGTLITKTLVIAGEDCGPRLLNIPGSAAARVRQSDRERCGRRVHSRAPNGSPMTYDERQAIHHCRGERR